MLLLRHCHLSSEDLITAERALLRFTAGRAKTVNLDFNVWDYTVPEIYGYILGMFVTLDLVDCLGISPCELLDFIVDVDRGYLATFYHSFYHAADVTAVLYHMLQGMRASQYLSKPDMAALLLAGLCHDIGHPGLNNLFQVNAKTELVAQHGEASVLEKYSCSLAMDLVTKHALFRNIANSPAAIMPEGQPATESTMRESMIKAILATDMTFHYDMLNNLSNLVEATTSPVSSSASEVDTESDTEDEAEERSCLAISPIPGPSIAHATETIGTRIGSLDQIRQRSVSMASPISTSTEHSAVGRAGRSSLSTQGHLRQASCDSDDSKSSEDSDSTSLPHSVEGPSYSPLDLTPEQRQNLCNCLLHAADISNAVKPWTVCKRWSDLVVQEFFRQGDIEKAQDLPVSPNMDRDQHNQPQISLGFGDFVVQPYFEAFVDLLPEASPVLTSLTNNRTQWVALQKSSQQFGSDPYLSVDPLEDPCLARRSSSPDIDIAHLPSGRRVSVAAGVLILDDTRSLRTPSRRLRHSTNTEATPGQALRRMKRSLSGRSLSTSMQNLHVHSTRSSHSSSKTAQGQDILISALKRQASLTERDMSTGSYLADHHHRHHNYHHQHKSNLHIESGASSDDALPPAPPPKPAHSRNTSVAKSQDLQKNKNSTGTSVSITTAGSTTAGAYRQKRLASLQVGSQAQSAIRQEYGDGYTIGKGSSTGTGQAQTSALEMNPTEHVASKAHPKGQPTPVSTQAGNRSSTPAVMMSKIKYDWALSPTLPEMPAESRFGCGPLDSAEDAAVSSVVLGGLMADSPDPAHVVRPPLTTAATRMVGMEPDAVSAKTERMEPVVATGEENPSAVGRTGLPSSGGTVLISTADSSSESL